MLNELFFEIAIVILTAGVLSLVAYRLRQPLIIAYILTGIVAGPSVFGFVSSMDLFETLSSIGIAFLLFIVGLNLNWRNVAEVGKVSLAIGFGQVVFTAILGWFIGLWFGFDQVTAAFLSIAFAFSSTIIIVKLLTDKEDIDRLYGRIAIGMLIVQDLIAIIVLLVLAAWRDGGSWSAILTLSFGKVVLVIAALLFLARYVIPHLFRYAAKSTELLFVLAIAWCFAISSVLQLIGFGIEVGALLAGLSLAGSGFQHEIEAKVRVLRDFFLVIFFIVLGTHLAAGDFSALILPSLAFAAFILIGNPLIVLVLMRVFGYHPRTGFLVGTTVAQISEFSFILLGAGVAAGLVDALALPLATVVGLMTIAGSAYLISYNEKIFDVLARVFPFLNPLDKDESQPGSAPEVVLLGYDRMGRKILPIIQELTDDYTVVDYNPAVIEELQHEGIRAVYGDAGNEDLLKFVKADQAKMIISAIPAMAVSEDIMDFVRARHAKGTVILTVKSSAEAARAYALGATFVIVPSVLGGEHFAQLLKKKKTAKLQWGSLGKKERQTIV
jgi:Kef-type K+ transport system membrane component KefB